MRRVAIAATLSAIGGTGRWQGASGEVVETSAGGQKERMTLHFAG